MNHLALAIGFAEDNESCVDISNLDAAQGNQDGFDQGDFIWGKGSHSQHFL